MSRLRALLGPLLVGVSVWCAAGCLTVATADAATPRVAAPAAWWVFAAAVLVAAAIPAFRRDWRLAIPALFATLPWWPVPLPAIALIWTGPLAWAPILLSVGAAVGASLVRVLGRLALARNCARAHWLAGGLTLGLAALAAWSAAPRLPGGDEPHYLVATQSLLADGDLQIQNNYDNHGYASYFGGTLGPDMLRRGKNGQAYSIHAPGLSVLVLPAFAIDGYRGAQATVLLLAAICGALIWRLAWRASKDTGAAWFAWAAIAGSSTFLFQSVSIFPDGPGAMVVAAAVLLILRLGDVPEQTGTRALIAVSALLAALPWLHTRFAVLAGALGLLVVWQLLIDPSRSAAARRARVAAFLALPLVGALAWFAFFQVVYGTPNPAAPYGDTSGRDGTRASHVPGGLVALLFDGQFGLLAYTPVLIVAFLGVWREGTGRLRNLTAAFAGVIGVYFMVVTAYWMWWAGRPATAARFATAALPLFAPLLAVAWTRASMQARRFMLALLGLSLAITAIVVCVDRAGLAWNDRDAQARWLMWLSPVVSLPRAWPSFFLKLNPDDLATEMPFAVHAGVWIGVLAAGAALVIAAAKRATSEAASRVVIALGVAVCVMCASQAGWWLTTVTGLEPARSQVATLGAAARAGSVVEIGRLSWRRSTSSAGVMTIRSDEPGLLDSTPPALALAAVPAGTYELRLTMIRPRQAQVIVRIGRTTWKTFDVAALKAQSVVLALPAGAMNMSVPADAALRAAGLSAELAPIEISADPVLSRAAARYGSADVFFLDDAVFPESDGFWVRGSQTADVVLSVAPGVTTIPVIVRNGAVANAVVIEAGAFQRAVTLGPSEERVIDVPVGATGGVHVRITAPAGFRPSEADRRFLGIWVQPK